MHRLILACVALCSLLSPALAQTSVLPEIGIQASGPCPALMVRNRASKSMLPIGCVDTATNQFTFDRMTMRGARAPTFNEAFGVLGRGAIFDSAGVFPPPGGSPGMVMPADKQFDYMGWRDTIQQNGGSKVSWLDYDLTINGGRSDAPGVAGSNAYALIGNITNNGPGTIASIYGRATVGAANTGGNAIAYKGGITTNTGAGITMGFQMQIDSMNASKPVDYGYQLDSNNYGGYGYGPLSYGFLATQNVRIQQALVQGTAGGPGDALRWLSADNSTYLAKINNDGSSLFQGVTVGNGGMNVSGTSVNLPVQGTVIWANANRNWQGQAVTTGDKWRLLAGGVGDALSVDANRNLGVAGGLASVVGAVGTVTIPNGTCPTAAPTGGGILCVEGGALKFRGSSGTLTTIAPP